MRFDANVVRTGFYSPDDPTDEAVEDEDRCEVREGEDRCQREATLTYREPYTPKGFRVHCCEEHSEGLINFGYTRDVITFPESSQLKSCLEVQSERENQVG